MSQPSQASPQKTTPTSPVMPRDVLWQHHCSAYARISQYDYSRYNVLTNQVRQPLFDEATTTALGNSQWRIHAVATPVSGDAHALDLSVSFECMRGELTGASLSVDLDFSGWSEANYVLLPAAAYQGNRFPSRRLRYSPKLYEVQDIGPDKPIIVADIPRLSDNGGVSRIQERSSSLATPAIGFHDPLARRGFWLLTGVGNQAGDYGLSIEESRDRQRATLSVTTPVVRELYNYRICDLRHPSIDRPRDYRAGEAVTIKVRFDFFAAPELQALFDRFVEIRKRFISAPPLRATLPFSACFAVQQSKFNTANFVPEHGYYSVGLRENFLQDWQIGWTGGMISTYPLLFAGSAETRANVIRNFDWLFPKGLCPAGFFWDCGRHGTEWIGGDIRKPHTGNWHLIRKSGDGVYYIVKQLWLMERLAIDVKPAWREGVRQVCDSLVRLWKKSGQFGQFVDSISGDVVVGGSSGGAIIPAALVLASRYFGDAGYLEVAAAAGEHFYANFTKKGLSCGGPGDALQANDSESWYALIESYALLADATRDAKWRERAGEQARQFATWVVSYDYPFPQPSLFGRAGIRSTGAVYANTQNKHAAPGICTYSGLALLRLFRATGDRFYIDLLRDIAHSLPQYLPHPLKPLGEIPFGRICERVNLTDWEGPERVGELATPGTWAETSLMLTTMEIPGLYVLPDASQAFASDGVEAEITADSATDLVVRLTNPTPAHAEVRVFSEQASETQQPLPENYLFDAPVARLAPGKSCLLTFPKSRRHQP